MIWTNIYTYMVNSPKSISNKCLLQSPLCILNSRLKICLWRKICKFVFGVQPQVAGRSATVERRPYWHEVTLLILNEDSSYIQHKWGFLMFTTLILKPYIERRCLGFLLCKYMRTLQLNRILNGQFSRQARRSRGGVESWRPVHPS